jgi:hypothetical protein
MTVFCVSGKFANDARKAFFGELTMRLEYLAESLTLESALADFDEMTEIIAALRSQANEILCEKIMAEREAAREKMEEVKF